jgi:hypothetical protein
MKMLRQATFVLWILCLLLAGAGFLILIQPISDKTGDMVEGAPAGPLEMTTDEPQSPEQKPFEHYEKVFSKREVFQTSAWVSAGSGEGKESAGTASGSAGFLDDHYKIVGIIIDQQPRVVFEDKKDRTTLFLSVGDTIDRGIIKEILPGKVVLIVDGYAVEMSP